LDKAKLRLLKASIINGFWVAIDTMKDIKVAENELKKIMEKEKWLESL